jgi:NADH-quinone oxidoreductase subunit M
MMLLWLLILLLGGGFVAILASLANKQLARWVSFVTLVICSLVYLPMLSLPPLSSQEAPGHLSDWLAYIQLPWIPRFGIHFTLAADGISLLLIGLTLLLGFVALFSAWRDIQNRTGFFHFNFLWTLAGVIGVFTSLDLFLFFTFWEVMLIPMFLMISIWGQEKRHAAALKFFIYTQTSGMIMLLSILSLVFIHWQQTGIITFSWFDLLTTQTTSTAGLLIMLGFFIAFIVKLPGVPVHNWLPDAYTQAPTTGSILLAGILSNTGAYGLLRFIFPLFPDAAREFTPIAMVLGVISVLYAAKLAFAQHDMKRLIAYTSISHMGFVIIGLFAWNTISLQGSLMQMVAHSLSATGLFALAGSLQWRLQTRDLREMGGLWSVIPKIGAIGLFFCVASLGLPGLGNFVGEFLVLIGSFQTHPVAATVAALGMILAPIYALSLLHRAFYGQLHELKRPDDVEARVQSLYDLTYLEMIMMGILIAGLVITGIFPRWLTDYFSPSLHLLQQLGERVFS